MGIKQHNVSTISIGTVQALVFYVCHFMMKYSPKYSQDTVKIRSKSKKLNKTKGNFLYQIEMF
jgi:hypothetical protein